MKVKIFLVIFCIAVISCGRRKFISPRKPRDAVWQPVLVDRDIFYVYSAYADSRRFDHIKIIAVKSRLLGSILCRIWMSDTNNFTVKASFRSMKEDHNKIYSSTFVLCHLEDVGIRAEDTVGSSVSVISALFPTRPHMNKLIILGTKPDPNKSDDIHMCMQPVHSQFFRPNWLIEWIEMNLLLGIKQVYVYKESVDDRTDCMFRDYQKKGYVTYLNWSIPVLKENIWVYGQLATINDCLYRSMSKAGWLMVTDLDELVLPRNNYNYSDLLRDTQETFKIQLSSMNITNKDLGAILIRNVFFYVGWEDDPESPADLITAKKTRRLKSSFRGVPRSKYVVRPYQVVQLMIHCPRNLMPNAVKICIPLKKASLHHYRKACGTLKNCLDLPSEIDRTAHRWSSALLQRVERQMTVSKICCENINLTSHLHSHN